jgi:hypothetical protein
MVPKKIAASRGFTLVELLLAVATTLVVALTVGMALAESQRNWNVQYDRIYSDVVTDGYVARRKFDAVMRKASRERFSLDDAGGWVEVYYYASDDSAVADRYARFYAADRSLKVEYGRLNPRETLSVETVCRDVSGLTFEQFGRSIQMILTLDDGTRTNTVITSAVTHN